MFDFGERRIGVATANSITGTTSALTTVAAKAGVPDWVTIDRLVREWAPDVFVVGVPQDPGGNDSPMTARIREFAKALGERYGRAVDSVDESFTSTEATAMLRERRRVGLKTRRIRKEDVDSLAASLIAEAWLQQRKSS